MHLRQALHRCVDMLMDAIEEDSEATADLEDEYSTLRLPPDCQRKERFHELLRCGEIEGGVKRGRHWFISREAWKRQRNAKPSIREVSAPPEATELASKLLEKLQAKERKAS